MKKYRNPSYVWFSLLAVVTGVVLTLADLEKFQNLPHGDTPLRAIGYLGFTAFGIWSLRIRVAAGPDGVRVVNLTGSRQMQWNEITGISLETSLVLTLTDGSKVKCVAVQPTNFENASGRQGYAHRTLLQLEAMRLKA